MIEFGHPLSGRTYLSRPGAYGVLLDARSRILVVEASGGKFYLPGGGLKANETAEQAVAREFTEETGLQISCGRRFATATQFVDCLSEPNGYEKICSFFLVEQAHEPQPAQGEYPVHWLDLEKAQEAMFEEVHRWAIARVAANHPQ